MGRTTRVEPVGARKPEIGLIVLFHPARINNEGPLVLPAIIHYVSDAERGIVSLTAFSDAGPKLKFDVGMVEGEDGHWSYRL